MRKWIIGILTASTLVSGVYWFRDDYRAWRHERHVAIARRLMERGDLTNGLVALRLALNSGPKDVAVCRMIAEVAEALGAPSALAWRRRVVELEGCSTADRLALARAALGNGVWFLAETALEGIESGERQTPEYQRAAAALAMATGRVGEAETHLSWLTDLNPEDAASEVRLQSVRLLQTNAVLAARARQSLEGMLTNAMVRDQVLRQLTLDAIRQGEPQRAGALGQELLRLTNGPFADRMMSLEALWVGKAALVEKALDTIQEQVAGSPNEAYAVARWMITRLGARATLEWVSRLPEATRARPTMGILIADCHAAMEDWEALLEGLNLIEWGDAEFLRSLQRSRAFRGLGRATDAKTEWSRTLEGTRGRLDRLSSLLRNATAWNWDTEVDDVLWAILTRHPREQWARQALYTRLLDAGHTRGLLNLFATALESNPQDLDTKNNLAVTALLLDAKERRPHELAQEVFRASPTHAGYAATYALSLHLQRRNDEALEILDRLKPEDLADPSIAACYGIVLQAAGQRQRARELLVRAREAKLLPEERRIVEVALAEL